MSRSSIERLSLEAEEIMIGRKIAGAIAPAAAVLAALLTIAGGVQAFDEAKYPDWKGKCTRIDSGSFDPTNQTGLNQQAPLTPEYQKILEANLAEQATGGGGIGKHYLCLPHGMPMAMNVFEP